jgi:hypothetical protein
MRDAVVIEKAAGRPGAARGQRQGHALALAPQPRFLQARSQDAARALSAHDPRAGGYYAEKQAGGKS